jgi:hypothetical protein
MTRSRLWRLIALLVAGALALGACSSEPPATNAQQSQQDVTEAYMEAAINAVPYPLTAMKNGGWLERTLLKENLLRQNNAHRRAFVVIMNTLGTPIVSFPIQGMVFDLNSQMTTEDIVSNYHRDSSYAYGVVTKAAGDNGTWGDEPHAISFFTTSGMQVKLPYGVWWIETDAPLTLPTKPLLVYDASKLPDITGGIVSANGIAVGNAAAKSK